MRVSRGERVAVMTPDQYARVGGRRTFEAAGVPAMAGGGFNSGSSSNNGELKITIEKVIIDAAGITMVGLRSSDGRKVLMEAFDAEIINNNGGSTVGHLEQAAQRRGLR